MKKLNFFINIIIITILRFDEHFFLNDNHEKNMSKLFKKKKR